MMSKFAKIFDVADTQVLAHVVENDDELPSLKIKTILNGIIFEIGYIYSDGDKGWQDADEALEKFNQEMADAYHAEMKSKYGELTVEPAK
jgi:hypothetical protein